MSNTNLECCVSKCDNTLDKNYWDSQYINHTTGWDLGEVSPALVHFINQIQNKNKRILIPGCGNAYEAEYLYNNGFKNITLIDISPTLTQILREKFHGKPEITIIEGDFFALKQTFDIILEQTFFCALPPFLREKYVYKMFHLLNKNGVLCGVLFNREFEKSPPFGGNKPLYEQLFTAAFHFDIFEECQYSATPRSGSELSFHFTKKETNVALYSISGLSCNSCCNTMKEKLSEKFSIENISISSDFNTILIVNKTPIRLEALQEALNYDSKYRISQIEM